MIELSRSGGEGGRAIAIKIGSSFAGQAGGFLLATAVQVLLARGLGPDGKGLFSLDVFLARTVFTLFCFGSAAGWAQLTGRNLKDQGAILGNALVMAVVWGGVVTLAGVALAEPMQRHWFADLTPNLVVIAIVSLVPLLLIEYSGGVLIGMDKLGRFNAITLFREGAVLAVIGYMVSQRALSVTGAVAAWALVQVLTALVQFVMTWMAARQPISINLGYYVELFKFTGISHVANLFSFLRQRFDIFLLAYFLTPGDVGVYSVAVALVSALLYLPGAISQVLIPHISSRDDEAGNLLTPVVCRIGLGISALIGLAIGLVGYPLISMLFGAAFKGAYPALLLLLPGGVVLTIARMLAGDLTGRGLPNYAMWTAIGAFALNLAVNLLLIPKFGIYGASVAATLTNVFTGLMFLYFFTRISGVRMFDTVVMRMDDWRLISRALVGRRD